MKKKLYIIPQMNIIVLTTQQHLLEASSPSSHNIPFAENEYDDDNSDK